MNDYLLLLVAVVLPTFDFALNKLYEQKTGTAFGVLPIIALSATIVGLSNLFQPIGAKKSPRFGALSYRHRRKHNNVCGIRPCAF